MISFNYTGDVGHLTVEQMDEFARILDESALAECYDVDRTTLTLSGTIDRDTPAELFDNDIRTLAGGWLIKLDGYCEEVAS